MITTDHKPVKCGLDFLRDSRWKPRKMTKKGAQREAGRFARRRLPEGFWVAIVVDCGEYFRISVSGQSSRD